MLYRPLKNNHFDYDESNPLSSKLSTYLDEKGGGIANYTNQYTRFVDLILVISDWTRVVNFNPLYSIPAIFHTHQNVFAGSIPVHNPANQYDWHPLLQTSIYLTRLCLHLTFYYQEILVGY